MSRNNPSSSPPGGDPRPIWMQLLIGLAMGAVLLAVLYFLGGRFL